MRVRVTGNLVIKQVGGANGKFCAGDLHTELGIFKVSEPGLNHLNQLADRCAFSMGVGHGR